MLAHRLQRWPYIGPAPRICWDTHQMTARGDASIHFPVLYDHFRDSCKEEQFSQLLWNTSISDSSVDKDDVKSSGLYEEKPIWWLMWQSLSNTGMYLQHLLTLYKGFIAVEGSHSPHLLFLHKLVQVIGDDFLSCIHSGELFASPFLCFISSSDILHVSPKNLFSHSDSFLFLLYEASSKSSGENFST